MYRFSVIIPHRNIPNLLRRCIDSIPERKDLQIIIVDDNSDPCIVDFEHFPGQGQSNIEIYFTKEGLGAGYCRNIGLRQAKGEWLLFADADDYFNKEELSILLNSDDIDNYDTILLGYKEISINGDIVIRNNLRGNNYVYPIDSDTLYRIEHVMPWQKMIKKYIVEKNNLLFEEIPVSNDNRFSYQLADVVKSLGVYEPVIYYYVKRAGSLVHLDDFHLLRIKMNVGIRYNKEMIKRNKSHNRDITFYFLTLILSQSLIWFYYYLIKECICVNFSIARFDYVKVVQISPINPNPIVRLLDIFRVKFSFHRLFSK